jgi:hypothetical protein
MSNPLPDLWSTRDLPALRRIAELVEIDNEDQIQPERVATDLGLAYDVALRSMVALYESGYIDGIDMADASGMYVVATDLTERGRRAVGVWPKR